MKEVIYYPVDNGGYMVDIYNEGWEEGMVCDGWFTASSESDAIELIKLHHPDAKLTRGVTGYCTECGLQHYNLETICDNCDTELSE